MEPNQPAPSPTPVNPLPSNLTPPPTNPLPKTGPAGLLEKIKNFIVEDKVIAILIGLAAILLIGGLIAALFLGKSGSAPTPLPIPVNTTPPSSTQVDFSTPSVSPSASPTASSSASPSASSSATASDSANQ